MFFFNKDETDSKREMVWILIYSPFLQSKSVYNEWRWIKGMERLLQLENTRGYEIFLRWTRFHIG